MPGIPVCEIIDKTIMRSVVRLYYKMEVPYMKKFVAPDGSIISMPEGRVIAYGLSPNEIPFIEKCLSSKDYELYVSDDVRDILAVSCFALIVEADEVNSKDREIITEYYTDLGSNFSETVFWIGYPKPPSCLRTKFRCYENFDELAYILPECLIKAHQKEKKARLLSRNLADCLRILSLIRSKPGINSQELAETLALPLRIIQRNISTLQAAGEWIEYDTKKRGWYLQNGVSILFGDHLRETDKK